MPLTPEQIAKIRQKEAETPDALKRNPLYNYTEGWFHVTLNTRGDAPVLGYLTGNPYTEDVNNADHSNNSADGSTYTIGNNNANNNANTTAPNPPRCVLTELGKKVEEVWTTVSDFHPLCKCEELQVMPEHIHALLHLLPDNIEHLGRIINGLMIGCTHCYWDTLGIPWHKMRKEKDAAASTKEQDKMLRAQWQDKDHTRSFRGPALFVHGYNDVEAVGEEEIEIKRQYIRNNPRKRLITRSKPDRFRIARNGRSKNWTLDRALGAVAADPWNGRNPNKCRTLQHNVNQRLKRQPDDVNALALDYVGNRALLSAERKVSLICHRADATLFEQQKAAVMQAARNGAIVVSAFVSPKERDIMKQLMLEQLPFIELMDNGFSDRYKPGGKAFYSIAENRHVQMTCWMYKYQPEQRNDNNERIPSITREMCLVMNELARIITGVNDNWWKN